MRILRTRSNDLVGILKKTKNERLGGNITPLPLNSALEEGGGINEKK